MRLRHIILTAFAALAAMAACVPEETPATSITLSPNEITVDSFAESVQYVTLTADGAWEATSNNSDMVLSISPSSGSCVTSQKIEIKLSENKGKDRSAVITFGSSRLNSSSVTIIQKGPEGDGSAELISVSEFLSKKDTLTDYCLEGRISSISNSSYYGFDLTDATGKIAIAFPTNFSDYSADLKTGGVVKVQGKYAFYAEKSTHQMQNGKILSYVAPEEQTEFQTLTVKEFIDKADVFTAYRLKGNVTKFSSSKCNFYLQDETGSIQIYTVSEESKTKYSSQLKDGMVVTLHGVYYIYEKTKTVEIMDAVIDNLEEAPEVVPVETDKVSDVLSGKFGEVYQLNGVTVAAVTTMSCLLTDGTDFILAYCGENPGVVAGNVVNVKGSWDEYNGFVQLSSPEITKVSDGEGFVHPEAEDITSTFDTFTSERVKYVTFTGTLSVSKGSSYNYYNVSISGATRQGSLANPVNASALDELNGIDFTFTGYYIYTTTSSTEQQYLNIILTDFQAEGDYFIVSPVEFEVPAGATSVSFNVVSSINWSVDTPEGVTTEPSSGSGNASVTLSFEANTDTLAKSYLINVTADEVIEGDDYMVTVNQAAYVDYGSSYFQKVTEAPSDWSGEYLIVSEDGLWAIDGSLNPVTSSGGIGAKGSGIAVVIEDGKIALDENTVKATVTLAAIDGGKYSIKSGTGKYFKEADKDDGKIKAGLQASDTPVGNTLSMREDKTVKILSESGDTSLLLNRGGESKTDLSQMFFRYYNVSNDGGKQYWNLSLYKLIK